MLECRIPFGVIEDIAPVIKWGSSSFELVKKMIDANESGIINLEDYWSLGDSREVTYKNTVRKTDSSIWQIVDFNGTSSGGTKYNMVIDTKNLFYSGAKMNEANSNIGGWRDCYMRNTIIPPIYNAIPDDFKSLIKLGHHISGYGNNKGSQAVETDDYLFLVAAKELNGTTGPTVEIDACKQFEYYKVASNRGKSGVQEGSSYGQVYWTRTPYDSRYYYNCSGGSSLGSRYASISQGISVSALV